MVWVAELGILIPPPPPAGVTLPEDKMFMRHARPYEHSTSCFGCFGGGLVEVSETSAATDGGVTTTWVDLKVRAVGMLVAILQIVVAYGMSEGDGKTCQK